jgi:hypothetical protein
MLHATVENTQRALGHLSPDTIAQAVALLQNAGSIAVVGDGLSASLAEYLALSLRMVGRPAAHLPGDALSLALWLNQMPPTPFSWRYLSRPSRGPACPTPCARPRTWRGHSGLGGIAAFALRPVGGAGPYLPGRRRIAHLALPGCHGQSGRGPHRHHGRRQPGAAANGPLWQHARDLLQPPRR